MAQAAADIGERSGFTKAPAPGHQVEEIRAPPEIPLWAELFRRVRLRLRGHGVRMIFHVIPAGMNLSIHPQFGSTYGRQFMFVITRSQFQIALGWARRQVGEQTAHAPLLNGLAGREA